MKRIRRDINRVLPSRSEMCGSKIVGALVGGRYQAPAMLLVLRSTHAAQAQLSMRSVVLCTTDASGQGIRWTKAKQAVAWSARIQPFSPELSSGVLC